MTESYFQNQAYPAYTPFEPSVNEATTFNLTANTIADNAFDNILNPLYPTSITCSSYFDGPMDLNAAADGIVANANFDTISGQLYPCDFYLNETMVLDTEADSQMFPSHISCDSDGNEPLTLNLATGTMVEGIFDIQNQTFPDFDEPTTREFQKWKENWDEKMLLIQWKREGKDWEDITICSKKMQNRNANARKSMLRRAVSEVKALGKAAAADREGEANRLINLVLFHALGDAVRLDYEGIWARISESMEECGSPRKWSSHRVRYAWNHGVSGLFPHITLRQRKVSKAILI